MQRLRDINFVLIERNFVERNILRSLLVKTSLKNHNLKVFTSNTGLQGLNRVFDFSTDVFVIDFDVDKELGEEGLISYLNRNVNSFKEITSVPVVVLYKDGDSLKDLSPEYITFNKDDKGFIKNLINFLKINIMFIDKKNDSNGSEIPMVELSSNSFYRNLLFSTASKTINYANKVDLISQPTKKEHHKLGILLSFLKILLQIRTWCFLSIFNVLILKLRVKDENKVQRKLDRNYFLKVVYPTALSVFGSICFVLTFLIFAFGIIGKNQPAQAAAVTWDGGGTDGTCGGNAGDGNKWSCAANWSNDLVPNSADTITFNSTSTKNSTIDAGFGGTVTSLNITTGYTGTITMERSFTTSSTFAQSTGTFNSSNQTLTITGAFTLSGGTFTASSATSNFANAITISGSPTFNHNSGTVNFNGATTATLSCNNVSFSLVTFTNSAQKSVSSNCSMPLGNNPTVSNAILLNGTLSGTGTLSFTTGTFTINTGAALTGFNGFAMGSAGQLTINGATVNFGNYTTVTFAISAGFTLTTGSFTAPSGTMSVGGGFTISSGTTFNHNNGTIQFSSTSGATIICNNATFNLVAFTHTGGIKTINSGCTLPLGSNPTLQAGITVNGTLSGTGTFTMNLGNIILNTGSSLSGFTGLVTNGTFTNTGANTNLGSYTTVDFNGAFTLNSGTFTAPSGTMTVASTFTIVGGTFSHNNGTVTFDGASGGVIDCNNNAFNIVSFAYTATAKTVGSTCSFAIGSNPTIPAGIVVSGTLSGSGTITFSSTLNTGAGGNLSGFTGIVVNSTFSNNGANLNLSNYTTVDFNGTFSLNTGTFTAPSGTMTAANNFTISGGTFVHNNGIVAFDSTANGTLSCNNVTFNLVSFTHTVGTKTVNSNCTLPLGNNPTLGITNAIISLSGVVSGTGTITIAVNLSLGAGGNFSGFTGLVSNGTFSNNGATLDLSTYTTVDFNNTFSQNTGTFTAPSGTLTAANNFAINGGTFNHNNGIVSFDAGNATITCNSAVFNSINFDNATLSGTKTISTGCNLPLGNNPNVPTRLTLTGGGVAGTGTITLQGNIILNAGGTLSGFTGLISNSLFVNSGATTNLGSYTTVDFNSAFTLSSGVFTAPLGTMTNAADFTITGGTFNHNNGTIILDGGATAIACNNALFNKVVINTNATSTTGVVTVNSNCNLPLGNNPTVSRVTLNGTLSGSGVLTFGNVGSNIINSTGSLSGFSGLVSGTSMTIAGANINLSNYSPVDFNVGFTLTSGTFTAPTSTMSVAGNFSISGGTFNSNNGTLVFDGGSATLSCNGATFNAVQINATAGAVKTIANTCTFNIGNNPVVNGDVHLSGKLQGTGTLRIYGSLIFKNAGSDLLGFNGFVLDNTGSNIDLEFTIETSANIDFSNYTLVDINGYFLIYSGTFTAPTGTMTLGHQVYTEPNTFIHNNGTVVFDGKNQIISGEATYNNFTKITNTPDTLYFPSYYPKVVIGTLTLQGTKDNLLSLRSSVDGVQWNINSSGARNINYVDVKDSNITPGITLIADDQNIDSGNNTNWNFNNTGGVSSLRPGNLVNGSLTGDSTPTFIFDINDPDSSDTVSYQIQIDDSADFSSLLIDFTSNLLPQGTSSYTVGQNNGVYASGNTASTLQDGSYYWKVRMIDNSNTPSNYVLANSGNVAFIVDSRLPSGSIVINNNSALTNERNVTLSISTNNASSNIVSMKISNLSDFSDATWEPYSNSKLWSLRGGDGSKTVYLKFKDSLDNESDIYFSSIILDTTGPEGSIDIRFDEKYIRSQEVNLDLTASDKYSSSVIYMQISSSQDFQNASWVNFESQKSWTLESGDGTKIIYYRLKDSLGNISNPITDFIILDTTAPAGELIMNNKDSSTTSQKIKLTINKTNDLSGVDKMILSENQDFSGAQYENYLAKKDFTLTNGYGNKTLYLKLKDTAGNESKVYSDSINYNKVASTIGNNVQITQTPTPTTYPTITPSIPDKTPISSLSIKLYIVDSNEKPLKDIKVLLNGGKDATTNEDGLVVFDGLEEKKYEINFTYQGKEYKREIDVNKDSSNTAVKIIIESTRKEKNKNSNWRPLICGVLILLIIICLIIYKTFSEKRKAKFIKL